MSIGSKFRKNNFFIPYLEAFATSLGIDKPMFGKTDTPPFKEKVFATMKQQAFNQLSDVEKKLFLYGYKIIVESTFYKNLRSIRGYEEIAFRCRGTAYQLAVEGFCQNCKINLLD